jgi:hypothetical protein
MVGSCGGKQGAQNVSLTRTINGAKDPAEQDWDVQQHAAGGETVCPYGRRGIERVDTRDHAMWFPCTACRGSSRRLSGARVHLGK